MLKIGRCAACDAGASATMGEGEQRVHLCYGTCMAAAEAWANQVNPDRPWLAPFAEWALARRNGTGPPGAPSSAGGAA